jgi:triphosphoribosyl-dephospho-CoA synthetase
MRLKKLVKTGNTWRYTLERPILRALDIDPHATRICSRIEGDCLVLRPVGTRRELSRARHQAQLRGLLEELDSHGLSRELFTRVCDDGSSLAEVMSKISSGMDIDPILVSRLRMCLERRKTCVESWENTIAAVMARRRSTLVSDKPETSDALDTE